MGILDNTSKKLLVESMRKTLGTRLAQNKTLKESVAQEGVRFVFESATYEQLLNLSFNPLRESKYLPSHVLEQASCLLFEAAHSGRDVIGVNAIAEAAMRVHKKTDAIITESAMDAALTAAKTRLAWQVLGEGKVADKMSAAGKAIKSGATRAASAVGSHKKPAIAAGLGLVAAGGAAAYAIKKAKDKKAATVKKEGKVVTEKFGGEKLNHALKQNSLNKTYGARKGAVAKVAGALGDSVTNKDGSLSKRKVAGIAGGVAAIGAGAYGIKKWRDKKAAEKAKTATA